MAAPDRLVVEADGAARGNPGPAGYGAVVRDAASGKVLVERSAAIGIGTNNVAEYRGLIAGLRAAYKINSQAAVEARLDSRLVVEQMSGNWKIKHPSMRPLAQEAAGIFPAGRVRYVWVPRERNAHADRLANAALDAAAEGAVTADDSEGSQPGGSAPGWASADLGTPTTLVLLRHGETELSAGKRFSGIARDVPLTERGAAQARLAGERLRRQGTIEAIVASPLLRARTTAEIVGSILGLALDIEDDLRECDFGDWEGHTFAELQAKWPAELSAWLASTSVPPPAGESLDAVGARVRRVRDRVVRHHPGRTVLVVSHVTPIKELVRLALDAPPAAVFRMELALAGISVVQWYADGHTSLRLFNDTSHLLPSS